MKLRISIIGFLLSFLTLAWAAGTTANLSWTAPTAYTDGSTLAASDIASYTITWVGPPSGSVNVAGSLTSTTVNVPCGSTSFTIAVTTSTTAKYPNTTSSPTSPVPYVTGIGCAPNPPGALAVH